MRKITLLAAIIFCFAGTANAQFLKKLGRKIQKASEKTVERKVEQKAAKDTEEAFDAAFNKERARRGIGMPGLTTVEPASNYAFNHKVEMQIRNGKDVMHIDYLLPNAGNFLGAQIKDEKIEDDFITVYDVDKEAMFTYMENDGQKIKMGIAFEMDDAIDEPTIDITATGKTKTILGYHCLEYQMTGEDMTATIWVTKDVDIRFPSNYYSVKQNKSNHQEWMKDIDGWAMEMKMVDTSKRKPQTIIMNCLSIQASNFQINSSDYGNMGY